MTLSINLILSLGKPLSRNLMQNSGLIDLLPDDFPKLITSSTEKDGGIG